MKRTARLEKRLAEARENTIEVISRYNAEIAHEKARMTASKNCFVRTCCQQTIDQLTDEKRAIEKELIG